MEKRIWKALELAEMYEGREITTHSGANYYYWSTSSDRAGASSYPADWRWIEEGIVSGDIPTDAAGIHLPGIGLIPWADQVDVKKVRRRIEDALRKAADDEIIRVAGLIGVKL